MTTKLMHRGEAWLGTRSQTAAGRPIAYRRGTRFIEITATPQMTRETVAGAEEETVASEIDQETWRVFAADLVGLTAPGETFEPQLRDVIEELDGQQIVWHVLPPAPDRQCWEKFGPLGIELSIHTKKRP
jgi:hypothetical protein